MQEFTSPMLLSVFLPVMFFYDDPFEWRHHDVLKKLHKDKAVTGKMAERWL